MAGVLTVPVPLDSHYRSSSPRCHSPRQSYTPPYDETTVPRSQPDHSFQTFSAARQLSPPPSSGSSPELPSIAYSRHPSPSSSIASSICLDPLEERDDPTFFPVYDFGTALPSPSPPPSPDPQQSPSDDETDTPEPQQQQQQQPAPGPDNVVSRPRPADDTCVRTEPSRHVDYLSHDWREEDIWASWRYMVGKRGVHTNSARLENASWRTWAKKKYRLETVSAKKLNWLKDCDVTWLYGPLSVGAETLTAHAPPSPAASPAEAKLPRNDSFYKTKPILKKRRMSEIMLQRSRSNSSLLKQATAAIASQQSNRLCPPTLEGRANSDFSSTCGSRISPAVTSDLTSAVSTGCQSPSPKRHIHFNDQVQQCIAVESDEEDDCDDFMYGRRYGNMGSDDGTVTMARKGSKDSNKGGSGEPQTIAHLPSTTLKYKEEPAKKETGSFLSLNSFFKAAAPANPAPPPASAAKSFALDDDNDLVGLDWEPNGGGFSLPSFGNSDSLPGNGSSTEDFQLPNFNNWEDDELETGLFGRAVDAVNTARDIAHVLWNVGWRR